MRGRLAREGAESAVGGGLPVDVEGHLRVGPGVWGEGGGVCAEDKAAVGGDGALVGKINFSVVWEGGEGDGGGGEPEAGVEGETESGENRIVKPLDLRGLEKEVVMGTGGGGVPEEGCGEGIGRVGGHGNLA